MATPPVSALEAVIMPGQVLGVRAVLTPQASDARSRW